MRMARAGLFTIGLCTFVTSCGGSSSPTAPSPAGAAVAGYAGQWSGTTTQGKPITVTVSQAQTVSAITFDYTLGSCSGAQTFSNLDLPIAVPPNPNHLPPSPPLFEYFSGSPEATDFTLVIGSFESDTALTGSLSWMNHSECGQDPGTLSFAVWSASKR